MNWIYIVLFLLVAYGAIAVYVHKKKPFGERVVMLGPFLAVKSFNVGIFDKFCKYHRFFKTFGSLGMLIVAFAACFLLFACSSFLITIVFHPAAYQAYSADMFSSGLVEPQNIFLLPGINEFFPSTFEVWFALLATIVIHEFLHGVLSRVEGIKVNSMGVLFFIVPIGFFVDPDEDALKRVESVPRARIYAAGIMGNLVLAVVALLLFKWALSFGGGTEAVAVRWLYGTYLASNGWQAFLSSTLIWCAVINALVGLTNALPMLPFDGGYIMKEGVGAVLKRVRMGSLTGKVSIAISSMILFTLIAMITLPYFYIAFIANG